MNVRKRVECVLLHEFVVAAIGTVCQLIDAAQALLGNAEVMRGVVLGLRLIFHSAHSNRAATPIPEIAGLSGTGRDLRNYAARLSMWAIAAYSVPTPKLTV